ncbi:MULTISPECIES: CDP-glycerol glycerophosphotransferase family protein [unclassified Microbacterium]|uniref:CDP-glycerol glycerophosphotransferase family protein n=1 Tax=unclassified Microbacterium TaxID=2609290 RepID=UPI000EA9978D|nr:MULTISPECIES: CDP-glycerol glycerophosphotransferase family protein [unclassified Microbacterium]MBT2485366.1 CDP-glycerol glycerophosphotransferase family protein [Microbacterium sp. ISL-108]RKN68170.1 glycosyl/glycerophosphate transferase [Microbacterium sp. CGR2]
MASFSFGTGNAAKLVRIPLYAAGRIGTLLVPRGQRWVFGCGAGIGDGALALHRYATAAGHDTLWLTSSDREDADAAALGIRTTRKSGLRGWLATATAGVLVVTHGLGDVNRYANGGAFIVQLWHGIPLKRIGLDSPATTQVPSVPGAPVLRRLVEWLYRSSARRISVLPAASHRSRGRLESAFGLGDERVVVTGEPRVDVLSAGPLDARQAAAQARLRDAVGDIPPGARTVLYAPTWRDGAADPAVPTATEWVEIIAVLEQNDAVLLVRSHPLGEGSYAPPLQSRRVRMLGASVVPDVTPVLAAVDVLVTDYSSLAYDVGLLQTPVLFLAPDAAEYAQTRGFYGRFEDVAGDGDAAEGWDDLLAQLQRLLSDPRAYEARSARSATLSAGMHAYRDGHNTRRVYQAIRARGIPAPKGAL